MMADILIVDDDEDLADTLADVLAGLGHHVREASNGREGLRALHEALPDVVVLDVEMPVLDGPGMANEMLVQDCGEEWIPVILISGFIDLPAIAEHIGTPYFAPKPCSLDVLLGLLEHALAERRPPAPTVRPASIPEAACEPRAPSPPDLRGFEEKRH